MTPNVGCQKLTGNQEGAQHEEHRDCVRAKLKEPITTDRMPLGDGVRENHRKNADRPDRI